MAKIEKALNELYRLVYDCAGVNFDTLVNQGITKQPEWYMNYSVPQAKQEELFKRVCKKYKLSKAEKTILSFNYYLGGSPTFYGKS